MNLQQPIEPLRLIGPAPPDRPVSLLKALKAGQDNPTAVIPRVAYREPVWSSSTFFGNALLVSDPAGVKQVLLDRTANYPKAKLERDVLGAAFGEGLLTSDGEKWRSHRRIMAPSFDIRSLVSYAPTMAEQAQGQAKAWAVQKPGTTIDIADEMTALTLQIISRTMFSADAADMGDLVGETLKIGQDQLTFSLLDVLPLVGRWHIARMMHRVHKTFSALDGAIYRLIAARAKSPSEAPRDLLDRLIAARDNETGIGMRDDEVRDEVVIIFLAGHETTAVTMTFVWYLLSQHPEAEAKLHAELANVLSGRAPSYADLAKLPYTRMVIEEAMRLYPPAPALSARQAMEADEICGYKVRKGQMVVIMPWVLHRHEKLWDDPLVFDPERFTPERSAERPRFAYLPFGGGPRICIGAQLAMMEASIILATLAQKFHLRLAPAQDIELLARITLRPRDGIKMLLEPR
jgi:cytochrome P450